MHSPTACHLLLFLRYPQVGRTKTRLIPALGAAGAAELQRQMAEYLVRRLQHPRWTFQVQYSGASLAQMHDLLGEDFRYRQQAEGDLGDRLWHGFERAFSQESGLMNCAIAIGADCPDLSGSHIQQAFDALQHSDVVLGPASDGGYYLIGLRQPTAGVSLRSLFQDIDWSTSYVFQQTMQKVQQLGLKSAQLEMLSDVDRPEDLAIWEKLQLQYLC